ncbi:hypothetical protein BGZ73_003878 [Actinomortierella ambigua]|nr:hypothetical protein BGZ73_003878 [Actinomortierella ambigua]
MKDTAKTEELISTLWRYVAERKRPSGKKSRDRRRGRPLVHPNEFDLACTVRVTADPKDKSRSKSESVVLKKRVLKLTSWKMNEYEYAKGSLPTLARGLFTYSEHDPAEDDVDEEAEGDNNNNNNDAVHASKTADQEDDGDEHDGDSQGDESEDERDKRDQRKAANKIDYVERSKNGRILIRGYNKFFNLEEVQESRLAWIKEHTHGPYEVTLKENGCIIFMAGLPPGYFDEQDPSAGCIVSSKHFLGSLGDKTGKAGTIAHSDKGREWLAKSLEAKGKTMLEFGRWLWKHQITAVAELCDDSFEEHVLEYSPERSGLYLHGLNCNTPDFKTWPSKDVYKAAEEWGFHPTQYKTMHTVDEVLEFTNKVRDNGEYDHRPIEGFVVRCKVGAGGHDGESSTAAPSSDHFFKIKYDEPYLMYREWREITKHLWTRRLREEKERAEKKKKNKDVATTGKADEDASSEAKAVAPTVDNWVRMRYPLTRGYVQFVTRLMTEKPELFAGYNKNQGIIAIRDMFLQYWETLTQEKQDKIQGNVATSSSAENEAASAAGGGFDRTLIIPIATIGCGKTTTSVALAELLGWAHVSSDDFNHFSRNAGQRFMKEVVHQLCTNDVVIADRNNHQFMHRERLMQTVRETWPKTRFVALYWSHRGKSTQQIIDEAADRVRLRGNNHQVMTPEYCPDYLDIIETFVRTFQPLNPLIPPDNGFHQVIEVQLGDSTRSVVQQVVDELVGRTKGANALPKPDKIDEAVRFAMEDWVPGRVATGEAEKHHQQLKKKQERKEKKLEKEREKEQQDEEEENGQDKDALAADASSSTESTAAAAAAAATSTATKKKKKAKKPKYYGIVLGAGAVGRMLQDEFQVAFAQPVTDGAGAGDSGHAAAKNGSSPLASSGGQDSAAKGDRKSAEWQACRQHVQEWVDFQRFKTVHHVTLIHETVLKSEDEALRQRASQVWKAYEDEVAAAVSSSSGGGGGGGGSTTPASNLAEAMSSLSLTEEGATASASTPTLSSASLLQAELEVDTLVWTDRLIAMPVRKVYRILPDGQPGAAYETTQKTLHITLALRDSSVKPVESNAVLLEWKQRMKRHGGRPGTAKEGEQAIWSFTFEKPYNMPGRLMGFAW